MERDGNEFTGRLKYEQFQFFFRKHWVRFIQPILLNIPVGLLILIILVALGRLALLVDYPFVRAFYVLIALVSSIGYWILASLQLINFYFSMVIITDARILIINKTLFLRNNSDAIDLTKIQDIGVESHGILCNYLRYGKLIITLSTSAPPIVIQYVPDPHYYLEWCNRVKREHIMKRRTDRYQSGTDSPKNEYLQDIKNLNL